MTRVQAVSAASHRPGGSLFPWGGVPLCVTRRRQSKPCNTQEPTLRSTLQKTTARSSGELTVPNQTPSQYLRKGTTAHNTAKNPSRIKSVPLCPRVQRTKALGTGNQSGPRSETSESFCSCTLSPCMQQLVCLRQPCPSLEWGQARFCLCTCSEFHYPGRRKRVLCAAGKGSCV